MRRALSAEEVGCRFLVGARAAWPTCALRFESLHAPNANWYSSWWTSFERAMYVTKSVTPSSPAWLWTLKAWTPKSPGAGGPPVSSDRSVAPHDQGTGGPRSLYHRAFP